MKDAISLRKLWRTLILVPSTKTQAPISIHLVRNSYPSCTIRPSSPLILLKWHPWRTTHPTAALKWPKEPQHNLHITLERQMSHQPLTMQSNITTHHPPQWLQSFHPTSSPILTRYTLLSWQLSNICLKPHPITPSLSSFQLINTKTFQAGPSPLPHAIVFMQLLTPLKDILFYHNLPSNSNTLSLTSFLSRLTCLNTSFTKLSRNPVILFTTDA